MDEYSRTVRNKLLDLLDAASVVSFKQEEVRDGDGTKLHIILTFDYNTQGRLKDRSLDHDPEGYCQIDPEMDW